MGLFDKVFSNAGVPTTPFNDPKDAFFAVLYACMSADGSIEEEELSALIALMEQKVLFRGADMWGMYTRISAKVSALGPRSETIKQAAPHVPAELKATLFANCVDFAASDGVVGTAEQNVLEQISQALGLDEQQAHTIIEVIIIKNKG